MVHFNFKLCIFWWQRGKISKYFRLFNEEGGPYSYCHYRSHHNYSYYKMSLFLICVLNSFFVYLIIFIVWPLITSSGINNLTRAYHLLSFNNTCVSLVNIWLNHSKMFTHILKHNGGLNQLWILNFVQITHISSIWMQ